MVFQSQGSRSYSGRLEQKEQPRDQSHIDKSGKKSNRDREHRKNKR